MKIKYNIPKINKMKEKYNRIKERVKSNKLKEIPFKYYGILLIVLIIGVASLVKNIQEYSLTRKEIYKEYEQKEDTTKKLQQYSTVESSISTIESSNTSIEAMSTNIEYILPVEGEIIKEYAEKKLVYSKTLQMWKTHPGIDIKADIGSEVISISDGKVVSIKEDSFYGNTVVIEDKNGVQYIYSNLDEKTLIEENDQVQEGEQIAIVGVSATGEIADEAHLHFEIIKDKEQVNPTEFLKVKE